MQLPIWARGVLTAVFAVLAVSAPLTGWISTDLARIITVVCLLVIALLLGPPLIRFVAPRIRIVPPPAWTLWRAGRERDRTKTATQADQAKVLPRQAIATPPTRRPASRVTEAIQQREDAKRANREADPAYSGSYPTRLRRVPPERFDIELDAYCAERAAVLNGLRELRTDLLSVAIDADAKVQTKFSDRLRPLVARCQRLEQEWPQPQRLSHPVTWRGRMRPYWAAKDLAQVDARLQWLRDYGTRCDQSNNAAISSQVQT